MSCASSRAPLCCLADIRNELAEARYRQQLFVCTYVTAACDNKHQHPYALCAVICHLNYDCR
jgi:hypothetical protein